VCVAAGAYFGELAIFTDQRRTASARAKRDCTLYNLSKASFSTLIDQVPYRPHFPDLRTSC
jgi:CRP-like cAMP-binding protein